MDIYLYQLASSRQLRLSVSIQVDVQFWQEKGVSIQSLYQVQSINQAVQLLKRSKCLSLLTPISFPSISLCWKEVQMIAKQLYLQFQGRSLLAEELIRWLNGIDGQPQEEKYWAAIQYLFLLRKIQILPGVESGGLAIFAKCNRCSAGHSWITWRNCATCNGRCAMCQHCYFLGRSRSCAPLFLFAPSSANKKRVSIRIRLPHRLTPGQHQAASQIHQFLSSNQDQLLFWAVTGAGKTECLVPAIKKCLEQGKKVLWVTPRKDVVLEVAPRLKQIFPTVYPIALYGGSTEHGRDRSLVIATAHQALRFFRYFDLGIVDEADAFPLFRNPMLAAGIRRALTPTAKQILLTATPPNTWKSLARDGKCALVVLPNRYHGDPLPVPVLKKERRLWHKVADSQPVRTLEAFIQHVFNTDGQAILFVPRLQDLFLLHKWMVDRFAHKEVAGVYAQDPERENKISQFRQGKIRFLISTTILERGVTVERCHVAVVGAEHLIFDRATLIQIAGRVGRSAAYQHGVVWFIAQEKTDAPLHAIREIKKLNHCSKKAGF